MSSRLHMKQMLQGLKKSIEEDLANKIKPLEKIKQYNTMLKKYKHEFAAEHDKEVESVAKMFDGEVIK